MRNEQSTKRDTVKEWLKSDFEIKEKVKAVICYKTKIKKTQQKWI